MAFVSFNGIHTKGLEIVNCRSQTMGGDIIGRTGFKFQWWTLESSLLQETHVFNHLASALIRWQFIKPFFFSVEYADTRRAIKLMSAEGEKVAVECLYVHFEMGHTLSAIQSYWDGMIVGYLDDFSHRIDNSKHVAYVGYADELGSR